MKITTIPSQQQEEEEEEVDQKGLSPETDHFL